MNFEKKTIKRLLRLILEANDTMGASIDMFDNVFEGGKINFGSINAMLGAEIQKQNDGLKELVESNDDIKEVITEIFEELKEHQNNETEDSRAHRPIPEDIYR